MNNHPAISSEVFQALYLNEDVYWVESEKPAVNSSSNSNSSSNTNSNNEIDLVAIQEVGVKEVEIKSEIVEKSPEIIVLETPKIKPEIVEKVAEVLVNEVVEKRIIPLLLITDSITEADKVFLEKVLNAVKLSLTDVEVFTTDILKTTDFRTYSIGKSYQRIISFGVPFSKIGMARMFMPYEITPIKNIQFLMAETLVVVQNDLAHKRQLWGCLQQMFNQEDSRDQEDSEDCVDSEDQEDSGDYIDSEDYLDSGDYLD